MMIFTTLLVAAVLRSAAACAYYDVKPDCSKCRYNYNIGVIPIPDVCGAYWECTRDLEDPYEFVYYLRCCAEGLTMNEYHQTCEKDYSESNVVGCQAAHGCCPAIPTTTAQYLCPYNGYDDAPSCPPATKWNQTICACEWIPDYVVDTSCDKLMSFSFENSMDSSSCNNVIDGTKVGDPNIEGERLNLNGSNGDALLIAYFENFFAWNPLSHQFTLCLWVNPSYALGNSQGIFSTNCKDDEGEKSLLDIYVEEGKLVVILGSDQPTATEVDIPEGIESKICVTFYNGTYNVFVNGEQVYGPVNDGSEFPVSNNEPAILGALEGYPNFNGYIDDFCFWTRVLSDLEIAKCYDDRANYAS